MSNFSQFTPTLALNYAIISTILTTAYLTPVLAEIPKWSTSATDLKPPSKKLASEASPTPPSLKKNRKIQPHPQTQIILSRQISLPIKKLALSLQVYPSTISLSVTSQNGSL